MLKTKLMLEYEKSTGESSVQRVTDGIHTVEIEIWSIGYWAWIEGIAGAYLRSIENSNKLPGKENLFICPRCGSETNTYRHPFAKVWCENCGYVLREEGQVSPSKTNSSWYSVPNGTTTERKI